MNIKKLLFFIISTLFTSQLLAIELDWSHDYESALLQAKQEKKDVYVFIGADRCRFCDRYKQLTLSDAKVLYDLNEQYIPVYLSRDRHKIPTGFATKGVPIHYFVKPDGKVYYISRGAFEIPGFYSMLDEAELNRYE